MNGFALNGVLDMLSCRLTITLLILWSAFEILGLGMYVLPQTEKIGLFNDIHTEIRIIQNSL